MSAPLRLTRAAAKARTRELLLAAAAQVFAEQGFAGASVDEIASRAGYTIGALYSHFSGKDELFLTLFDDRVACHLRDVGEITGFGDERAVFTALGDYLTAMAGSQLEWYALESEFLRYALTRPELLTELAERRDGARSAIARLIAGHAPQPEGDDHLVTATMVIALFEGLLMQRRIDPESVPPATFADALRRLLPAKTS
jgi:AcrR family transcriptional regulator